MYVISFANPKGGSGKTTAAMLLAEQIALSGGRVALLDLDPNANIVAWAWARQVAGLPTPFSVHSRPMADEVVTLIDEIGHEADYLIIDLEGSKDQIVTYALSRTDLCIIPMDGSAMEARQATQTVKLIETTARMIRQPIEHAMLFTRTNAAFQTADERDMREALGARSVTALPVRIARRAPFTRIFRDNVLLSEIPDLIDRDHGPGQTSAREKAHKQVASAIENARDYAQVVIDRLAREAEEAA